MKIFAGTIAGIVLVSTAAFAGGNPEDYPFLGPSITDVSDAALERAQKEVIQEIGGPITDQYQIKREVESEIRQGWVEMNLAAPLDNDAVNAQPVKPVTIARAETESECWAPFSWLASQLGGECFRDSNFHNPSPVGYTTVETTNLRDVVETKDKKFRTHSKRSARRLAGLLNRYSKHIAERHGYDDLTAVAKGKKVKVTLNKTVQVPYTTFTKVRNDKLDNGKDGGTMGDSNGMRGRDVDGGTDRF